MTPLEGQLVNTLVNKYKAEGINVQQILDNPLFNGLSLQAKLEAINQYAHELSVKPSLDIKQVAKASLRSALITGGLVALAKYTDGGILASKRTLAITGGIGGALGGINSVLGQRAMLKKDTNTSNLIDTGNSLQALVDRSFSPTKPAPNFVTTKLNDINIGLSNSPEYRGKVMADGSQITSYDVLKSFISQDIDKLKNRRK